MRKLLLITLSVLTYTTTYAQNINTIAGGLGDGGFAMKMPFKSLEYIAIDTNGNIYYSDFAKSCVQKVSASTGIISTVAGNGNRGYSGDSNTAILANLNSPKGVAVDDSGNIYIADANNDRIRKVTVSTGVISTIAGNGNSGFSGDGNAATLAKLSNPTGLTLDVSGNIYFIDADNRRIRKVTVSTGIISTVAGNGAPGYAGDGGAATSARLNSPSEVAVDSSGNIYIADAGNYRIRKVNASTGIISTVAGNGTGDYGGDGSAATMANLNGINGITLDDSGNIYIADGGNNRIRKVTASTGIISTVAGNGTKGYDGDDSIATLAKLNNPKGIKIDRFGNFYIADNGNNRIRKVTASSGIINTVAGNGSANFGGDSSTAQSSILDYPCGVAVDGLGNIYIADAGNKRIRKVTASSGIINTIAGTGKNGLTDDGDTATLSYLYNPIGVALDSSGNIYIVDVYDQKIRKVTASSGIINTIAGNGFLGYGGDGNSARSGYLNNPRRVAVDDSGNIYIADAGNHRIRKVTASTGIISTVAGNGTQGYGGDGSSATNANLNSPVGITVDVSGNIYIADAGNNRIRKVTASTGIISTVAGNGTAGYGGDGSAANSAKINNPRGVAVDRSGNIYIADRNNHRIRKLTASTGIINSVAGNGNDGYSGDGNTATLANINFPTGVAVDGFGNIYIADAENNRIRLVNYSIVNNIISNSQTICAGSSPASLTGSTPIGGTSSNTYSWLKSTTSAKTSFTAILSTNTINYSPGILTQNTWFRRYVVSGALTDTSTAVLIIVNTAISTNTITGTAQTICSGSIPATIAATIPTGGNGTNYKWLKSTTSAKIGFANAGGNDSTQNFTPNAITQNTWFRRRVSSGVCIADTTAALMVTVNPKPATSNITGLTNVARLDTASYSVTGTSGSVFNWVTTKGLVQTGTNTNQIQVKWNAIGMDTLKVTETSNQGCVGAQKILLVNIGPATGINEINTSNNILVYPNPFNETIYISLHNNSSLNKAILYDLLGKEILTTHKSEIDVKELKSGVYLIMVIDNDGNSYSQKLMKN